MNPGILAVRKLSNLGYRFELAGDRLRYRYDAPGKPDPDAVRPLLALVKENKEETIGYLARKSQTPEGILLCSECPWHRQNPWTHYPELPLWCSWHFDYLAADNPQCLGWRQGEIPHPNLMERPRTDDFILANDKEGASAEDDPPNQHVTCFQCHHFKPNDGPNPRQGWGWCLKRSRGRFGCATACEAAITDDGAASDKLSDRELRQLREE